MSFLQSIILGIIEGVTEFLPISSTGHMILASKILGLAESDFLKSFEISIQLGAILAVAVLYWKRFLFDFKILKKIAVAFAPTAVLGLIFYKTVKIFLGSENVVLWSLFIGGLFLIIFEIWRKGKDGAVDLNSLTIKQSFFIGLFQSVALIPGVSRAAATIVGGLFLGIKRKDIVEFSFLLAVPTMLAASGYDLLKSAGAFTSDQFILLAIGFAVSFFVAIAAVKFLLLFVKNHTFIVFGIYRVLISLAFWMAIK